MVCQAYMHQLDRQTGKPIEKDTHVASLIRQKKTDKQINGPGNVN